MSRIRIKNFGPIKEGYQENDGWMNVEKVTLFIGNQGSGKSTVAKTISTLMWLEKSLNRGDKIDITNLAEFKSQFIHQRIENYFKRNTVFEYEGDAYKMIYDGNSFRKNVESVSSEKYIVPKTMYIPAERNLLSTIYNPYSIKGLPESLFTFASELKNAQNELNGKEIDLPLGNYKYKYDSSKDESIVIGNDYKLNLLEASSGLQSLIPLYLVSRNLAKSIKNGSEFNPYNISVEQSIRMNAEIHAVLNDKSHSDAQKIEIIEKIKGKYFNKAFINIVEEPEQNLFPSSQWELLKKLLEFNNMSEGNKLLMTTHSPYLVNYLSIAIQAGYLSGKILGNKNAVELIGKMERIIPQKALVAGKDVVVYQLDETDGTVKKLPKPEGIPSDNNYLNQSLRDCNEMFDSLLEIEQEL